MSNENILDIRGLSKRFGSTKANINIDFTLKKGEIKGLIGENGSGKSTLLSQIAGVYGSDSGEMFIDGQPYAPTSPLAANENRISMVMQELGVVDTLPVGINVFLGRLGRFSKGGITNINKLNQSVIGLFNEWDLPLLDPGSSMLGMIIEQRKLVELVRALSVEPDVLLLDEITQSLSSDNRQKLYAIMNRLKENGKSVIVITHDVEEMMEITDSITVLRDGEVVGTVKTSESSAAEIRYMMVGREISGDYYRADHTPDYSDEVVLSVEDVTVEGKIEDVSFELHKGEILGFGGLSDSGIHSIGRVVYGLEKIKNGSVRLVDGSRAIRSAKVALGSNMAYVPKDRDKDALMIHDTILANATLPSLTELQGPVGFLSASKLKKLARGTVENLQVKTTGIDQNMEALSGGNKQKVNLGRWLAKDLKVLVLDCPTRGVDVGVKVYIYSLMKQAKKDGIATILISDELTEVLGMADRLIVMKDGRVTKTIRRDEEFTEHSVIEVMI
jgi:ribose transport system ATP-binding protein